MIIDLPDLGYVNSLTNHKAWCDLPELTMVIHLSGAEVVSAPEYLAWTRTLPSTVRHATLDHQSVDPLPHKYREYYLKLRNVIMKEIHIVPEVSINNRKIDK